MTIIDEITKADDTYLLWHPEALENLDMLPNSMTLRQNNDTAALVDMHQGRFPFFEQRVWYSLRNDMGDDLRIYSLTEVQQFFNALPWLAGIGTVLLCSLL